MTTNDTVREVFKTNLTRLIKEKNMTQKSLADYMGVSTATVSDWKNGNVLPRMDKIDKLCAYFHVSRTELLGDHFSGDGSGFMQFAEEQPSSTQHEMFSDKEIALMYGYRIAPPKIKEIVNLTLKDYIKVAEAIYDQEKLNAISSFISSFDKKIGRKAKKSKGKKLSLLPKTKTLHGHKQFIFITSNGEKSVIAKNINTDEYEKYINELKKDYITKEDN